MLALLDQKTEPFVADDTEAKIAKAAAAKLKAVAEAEHDVTVVVQDGQKIMVPLPARAVALIFKILVAMGDQKAFSIIPHEAEFTTQQAADYLNVSRPFLIGLLDRGEINHKMVGRHRRVRFADLLSFEQKSGEARRAAINEMAAEARRLELD